MSAKFAIIPGTGWKAVEYDDAVRKTARHENAKTRKTKDAETKNTGGNMTSPIQAFGIDIGGSGIKGAPVDLEKGEFAQKRLRIPTPENAGPDEVAFTVKQILDEYEVEDGTPVGVAFPAPVKPGRKLSFMANLAQSWVGTDVEAALSEKTGRRVHVINDADAAGLAEAKYGAAKNCDYHERRTCAEYRAGTPDCQRQRCGDISVRGGALARRFELEKVGEAADCLLSDCRTLFQSRSVCRRRGSFEEI